MTISMKGKERDLKLANELRGKFVKRYENNIKDFKDVIGSLGDNCLERLVYRFKGDYQINIYRDYNVLKEIAAEVRENKAKEIFEAVCEEDMARAWINDNGKYITLVFEALYKVFKRDEKLKRFTNLEEEAVEEAVEQLETDQEASKDKKEHPDEMNEQEEKNQEVQEENKEETQSEAKEDK